MGLTGAHVSRTEQDECISSRQVTAFWSHDDAFLIEHHIRIDGTRIYGPLLYTKLPQEVSQNFDCKYFWVITVLDI